MKTDPRAALVALSEALAADPEACSELAVYGDLPEHLGDAVAELVTRPALDSTGFSMQAVVQKG